ncbi:hemerythrin domain-containing protein [Aestuariivirga sp.]|uniref:hemerythrin domain-containing protein n=1 Tax=Aestuariivirga sp. TaxID=2650926 RepID=UPI0039E27348
MTNSRSKPGAGDLHCPSTGGQPLAVVFSCHLERKTAICNELEHIADALPLLPHTSASLETTRRLLSVIEAAHDFEEKVLFPSLLAAHGGAESLVQSIRRLEMEHLGDSDFAQDIYHATRNYVTTRDRHQAEALAWMLRGFFESQRRHIAFEREHIMPLVRQMSEPQH